MAQEGFLGEIRMFGGNFAPRSWAFCNGQLLSIAQNTALFSILGTTYGGDGRTTFALPDLRGRAPVSEGTGPGLSTHRLGSRSGVENQGLNFLMIPSHSHSMNPSSSVNLTAHVGVNSGGGDEQAPGDNALAESTGGNVYSSAGASPNEFLGGVSATTVPNIGWLNTGGSQTHNNMQPYLVVHYIIALQGTFPSRS